MLNVNWQPPVPYPKDAEETKTMYQWDEKQQNWVPVG